jgi:hypothetical protein
LDLDYASRLVSKYLHLREHIRDYVESFIHERFHGRNVIGLHYRGTDKSKEAQRVTWERCVRTIHNYLDANPEVNALFVSSDEAAFVERMGTDFRRVEVICHPDSQRTQDGEAVHTRPGRGNNYEKAREALVNCLLLSRCRALIRTASFLSAWSSIFNPRLPIVLLNAPDRATSWFPDSQLVNYSMIEYLP